LIQVQYDLFNRDTIESHNTIKLPPVVSLH
jgi:hypothetical protein